MNVISYIKIIYVKICQLKKIFLFYSIFENGFELSKTVEKFRCVYYNAFFDIPYNKHLLKFRKKIIKMEREKKNFIDKFYRGENDIPLEIAYNIVDRMDKHLKNFKRNQNGLDFLYKLSKLIKEDKKELYIILPPYRNDYLKHIGYNNFTELKQQISKIIPQKNIVDLTFNKNFQDNDFYDTDHMNLNGSKKFSKLLNNLIR